jgi:hypothetical protein
LTGEKIGKASKSGKKQVKSQEVVEEFNFFDDDN